MIRELLVENIAIIDQANLSLQHGFTVLTGETGAGKSLLVDAINLSLGHRADSDLVRTGAKKGLVCLVVDLNNNKQAQILCQEFGIELENNELIIQREITQEGRSTVRLNGVPSTVKSLKQLGLLILDLHGQHDHQTLLNEESQLQHLDSWIGKECSLLKQTLNNKYQEAESLKKQLSNIRLHQREREQRIDLLKFQVEELTEANIQTGEINELQNTLSRLMNSEKLGKACESALQQIHEKEGSTSEVLNSILKQLQSVLPLDPNLQPACYALNEATLQLEECISQLSSYQQDLDADPNELEETAQRLDLYSTFKRKYGDTEEEMLEYLSEAITELEQLESTENSEEELEAKLNKAEEELQAFADNLTQLRTSQSKKFSMIVQSEVRELAMENALFAVDFTKHSIQPNGQDEIQFLFTSNKGEKLKPISKVASGGELSRLMLSIKVASAGKAGVPCLIFDEIDAGLSGKAAAITAKKLNNLSKNYQVLAISHLPQVASKADHHLHISKQEKAGRTLTEIHPLNTDERVQELARMLAGEQVGETALANAKELLSAYLG